MFYTWTEYNVICQLHLNKKKGKRLLLSNNQVGEMQGSWLAGKGAELPYLLQVCHAPSTWSPTQKVSESHTLGIFIKALSHRQDHLLTQSPEPLPSLEESGWGRGWTFQASNHGSVLLETSPHPAAILELSKSHRVSMLLAPLSLKKWQRF